MNKNEGIIRQIYNIRKWLVGIYSIFIGAWVSYIMLCLYVPGQNSLKALASVCMDIICMIILLIYLLSIVFDYHGTNRTTKLYALLLVASLWATFTDFLNWAFDGSLELGHLTFWFTVGSLCMGAVLAGVFVVYLYNYLRDTHDIDNISNSVYHCVAVNILSFVLTFILAISGTAFKFVNGHYELGLFYDVVTVIPILTLLYFAGLIIYYRKKIGAHDVLAIIGYILIMITGALIEATYGIGTSYVGVSIADIFIFVMLQNQIITQEKQKTQTWMNKSKTDHLTGLSNRYAYETDFKALEDGNIKDNFVYVSSDVNSLKEVNDTYGHYAGDELLIAAAECFTKCFGPYGKLYRMGGDEFIALIYADTENLNKIKAEFEKMTANWVGKLVPKLSVSCGYVTKEENPEMPVKQMALLADRRMYEAKNEYYRKNGIDRRRQ